MFTVAEASRLAPGVPLALVDRMTQDDLEGSEFTDTYTDALAKIIEAKREEKPLPEAPELERPCGATTRCGC